MIEVRVGEVSIGVTTVAELSALVMSPEFKNITAVLKNGHHANGTDHAQGNGEAPALAKKSAANGEKASRKTVIDLIRQNLRPAKIAEQTGWTNKQVGQLKWYLKARGSDAPENTQD